MSKKDYVDTYCPHCDASLQTPYIMMGVPLGCTGCLETIIPSARLGSTYPDTGCELTYSDFIQLVKTESYRETIGPMLHRWFGVTISNGAEGVLLLNSVGEALDALWLHKEVQSDADRQNTIYNAAMSFWR